MNDQRFRLTRRLMLMGGVAVAGTALTRSAAAILGPGAPTVALSPDEVAPPLPEVEPAAPAFAGSNLDPRLMRGALGALQKHAAYIPKRDRIAIVDFSAPSSESRLHFLDVVSGAMSRLLVTHGSGSDPSHTGLLQRFSNSPGSNATSEGAYVTTNYYVGKHGPSQRLIGLDPTNNNALDRAIVLHSAWYANADMLPSYGKLGRSQGCFAVGEDKLDELFGFLGEGRMIYAAKV